MPEALARVDHDHVLRQGKRGSKPRRPAQKPSRFRFLAPLMRRPGRTLLFGCGALLVGGIGVNALFLQNAPHPAPFFRSAQNAAVAETPPAPLPPARPAETAQRPPSQPKLPPAVIPAAPERAVAPAVELRANASVVPKAAPQPPAARRDQIAELLRDGRPSAPTPPAAIPNATAEQTKRIFAVQEALKKLGHNVKLDGVAGPTTRVAIEAFERAQKWQVTGQMSPKVLRELATRSGVKIP